MSTAIISKRITESSPRSKPRLAGLLYWIAIIAGVFGELFVRGRLSVAGPPGVIAHNIAIQVLLYRCSFSAQLISTLCNLPIAMIFLGLSRIVSRSLSLTVAFFMLAGAAVETVGLLAHFAPLPFLGAGFSGFLLNLACYH